jgi:hypothetical protein
MGMGPGEERPKSEGDDSAKMEESQENGESQEHGESPDKGEIGDKKVETDENDDVSDQGTQILRRDSRSKEIERTKEKLEDNGEWATNLFYAYARRVCFFLFIFSLLPPSPSCAN